MLRFILGGISLVAAGYGLKKYVDNEENHESIRHTLAKVENLASKVDAKVNEWTGEKNSFKEQITDSLALEESFFNDIEKRLQKITKDNVAKEEYLQLLDEIRGDVSMEISKIETYLELWGLNTRLSDMKLALYDFKKLVNEKMSKALREGTISIEYDSDTKELSNALSQLKVYQEQEG